MDRVDCWPAGANFLTFALSGGARPSFPSLFPLAGVIVEYFHFLQKFTLKLNPLSNNIGACSLDQD